jgi:hypothetical protein
MKLSTIIPVAIFGALSTALEGAERYGPHSSADPRYASSRSLQLQALLTNNSPSLTTRASTSCSIGIGRVANSISWDVTVYDVPQSQRQDVNIIGKFKNQIMDKGQSVTLDVLDGIKITNVDNAPPFNYDNATIIAPLSAPTNGLTKVDLAFEMGSTTWNTTSDCWPASVVFSANRESWSCDFECGSASKAAREL